MNRLILLEKRRERSNEMDLLEHFMEELSVFETKLVSALVECRNVVNEVQDSLVVGGGDGSSGGSNGSSSSADVPSMFEKLLEQLTSLPGSTRGNVRGTGTSAGNGGGASNGLDVAQSWSTLLLAIKGSAIYYHIPFDILLLIAILP